VNEGAPLNNVTVATFTDPSGSAPLSAYSAAINWGDGSPPSLGTISGPVNGVYTVTGSHTYTEESGTASTNWRPYTLTVTVYKDADLLSVVANGIASNPLPFGGASSSSSGSVTVTVKEDLGILLLDPTGARSLMVTGNGTVDVTGAGAVVVDSNNATSAAFVTGNGVVEAADFDVTGGLFTSGHGMTPPKETEPATKDPLGLPLPPAPPVVSSSTLIVNNNGSTPVHLSPGTYIGGIKIVGSGPVVLGPGVYYMQGGGFSVTGKGSVTGTGVLLINAPAGPTDAISLSGQGSVSLVAPTSLPAPYGSYAGIAIFQAPTSAVPIGFGGQESATLSGVIYAPGAAVTITGNAAVTIDSGPGTVVSSPPITGALIASDLTVTGNGSLTVNPDGLSGAGSKAIPGPGGGDIYSAALAAIAGGGPAGALTDPAALEEIAVSLAASAGSSGNSKPKAS
jgi:hypothetical protein